VLGQLRDQMEVWIVERQGLNAQFDRLNSEINRAVPEAVLETPDSGGKPVTYLRGLACVVAVEPGAEPFTASPPARPTP